MKAMSKEINLFLVLLSWLIVQPITNGQGLQDGSNMPDNKNQTCSQSSTTKTVILRKSEGNEIFCGCEPTNNQTIAWYDESCQRIRNSERFVISGRSLKVLLVENKSEEWKIHCTDEKNCSFIIRVTPEKEDVSGISTGLLIFLIILILFTISLASFIIYKKYKQQIYLGCRDICAPSTDRDGKTYDAYISIGKNTSDNKFVERNITDILQRRHGYKFFIDEDNLLPQLDFSEKVQSTMHKCRRLIIVFTPAYMANDWCMYCFSEGLRKLLELQIKMIFIISDVSIERELNSYSSLIGHVPKVFISFLPMAKSKKEKKEISRKIRCLLPPSKSFPLIRQGMRTPMLSEVEEIDERSTFTDLEPPKGTKYIALETTSTNLEEDDQSNQVNEDGDDPNAIKVHHYKAKKDFYSITAMNFEDD